MIQKKEFIEIAKQKISKNRIVDLTIDLCRQDTSNPPGKEFLCEPIINKFFNQTGYSKYENFEKEKGRSNIVVTFCGKRPGPKVCIVTHTDVVPVQNQKWKVEPFQPVIKKDKLIARGSADNKGPMASVSEAVQVFWEITKGDFSGEINLIFASDEECGSENGVKYLFGEIGLGCDFALIPDNGEKDELIFGEMGILLVDVEIFGKAFHGSKPEMGANAIIPLSDLVTKIGNFDWEKIQGDESFDHTVLNIGLIQGGTSTNTVPDYSKATFMWRYPVGVTQERILKVLEKYQREIETKYNKIKTICRTRHMSYPFKGRKDGMVIQKSFETAKDLNFQKPMLKTIRAETVAKYIHEATNAEVIVNGPENGSSQRMHIENEYISINSLVEFSHYYSVLLYNLLCTE